MIDLEKAKQEFLIYTSNYDTNNSRITRKINHSIRVMEYSKKIAQYLNLKEEEINLATLIGLLHDIARFEQMRIYKTFSDLKSIDHGDLGAEILSNDNFIRKFIDDDKYDEIIKTAIRNHNKFKIEDGLDNNKLLFSKIIRDADKLDIFFEAVTIFWNTEEEINLIKNSELSDEYFKTFSNKKPIKNKANPTKLDGVISLIAFIFDINFEYSLNEIKENDFINKILNKFSYKNDDIEKKIEIIRNISNEYLNKR